MYPIYADSHTQASQDSAALSTVDDPAASTEAVERHTALSATVGVLSSGRYDVQLGSTVRSPRRSEHDWRPVAHKRVRFTLSYILTYYTICLL